MIINQGLLPVIARYTRPLVLLVCMVFVTCVQIRVVTYVCGNDPMLYQRAARVILQPELYGMTALREALTFVAPGYTLLLAMTIRLFGDLAPYWLNFGLLLISLPLMWIVFRALTGSDQAAGLIIMLAMPVLFGGHELSAPFLLYPFREMPVVLCVFAA